MTPELNKLNMGCGYRKLLDHWNVDVEQKCNPDQILDLENIPWPYEDNFFEKIVADNILEHLGQAPKLFTSIIKEMYRVSKDKAEWFIKVPHHRSDLFWDDYTHVRSITPKLFLMFDQTYNFETISRGLSESTFGLYHEVDLEIFDVKYNITSHWLEQLNEGIIGPKQLNLNLNFMSNVVESVDIFIKVHKPGRYNNLVKYNI